MSLAWSVYRALAPCVGALLPLARSFVPPREKPLWSERLGKVQMTGGAHAWIHSASLGEASAVGPLVAELAALQPDARLHLTANTRTGRERLAALGRPVSLAPIDTPQSVRRFFEGIEPRRLILVETEIWPHWLLRASAERVPVAMVSARLGARSVSRYRRLGSPLRRLIGGFEAVLCQTDEDRSRWLALGARAERTEVVGNLKHDAVPPWSGSRAGERVGLELDQDRPLLVLGSLRPGEARLLARACARLPDRLRERWQVVAVPRHARATADLRAEAEQAGITPSENGRADARTWRWDDRSGVLNTYYAAADLAFVGGSLLAYGGHNPIEPAAFGAAVLMGEHHASQADAVTALAARRAIRVVHSEDELGAVLETLLGDEALCLELGRAARQVVEERRGAARRAVARLATLGLWPVDR